MEDPEAEAEARVTSINKLESNYVSKQKTEKTEKIYKNNKIQKIFFTLLKIMKTVDHIQLRPNHQPYKPNNPYTDKPVKQLAWEGDPLFTTPTSTIRQFNEVFPLPKKFFRRNKDGVRVWMRKGYLRPGRRSKVTAEGDKVVDELLETGIIRGASKNSRYLGSMFLIPKGEDSVRPIFNYKPLTKHMAVPKFVMPSMFQVVRKLNWPQNLYYTKIDIKQAFFCIDMHPKSNFITKFSYNNKFYTFNRLPFGLALAPYICQTMLNAVMKEIRRYTKWTWGHMDDILLAHEDPIFLKTVTKHIIQLLLQAGWKVNEEKTVVDPVTNVEFLGADWTQSGVRRKAKHTHGALEVIANIHKLQTTKQHQVACGYLNYYMQYAGPVHSLVNRAVKGKSPFLIETLKDLLLQNDNIKFYFLERDTHTWFSDATPYKIAAVDQNKTLILEHEVNTSILMAEAAAALMVVAFIQPTRNITTTINLGIDNMAVVHWIRNGACNWSINEELHAVMIRMLVEAMKTFILKPFYVKSRQNPADLYSRRVTPARLTSGSYGNPGGLIPRVSVR